MTLREAWTRFVNAEDYERHMAAVGQAQANASLVAELVAAAAPPPGSRVLIAGAGTGQIFEYCPPALFRRFRLTCSDLNPAFLEKLRSRCPCITAVDDIEDSRLDPGFSLIVVVLVLEHVDWRKALISLARLRPEQVAVVIQRNPEGPLPHREHIGTMRLFGTEVEPKLIDAQELIAELARLGFGLRSESERPVLDGKTMVGLLATAQGH
jgi:SAM-dependent methyltransferase